VQRERFALVGLSDTNSCAGEDACPRGRSEVFLISLFISLASSSVPVHLGGFHRIFGHFCAGCCAKF
jgi:hypothetical protein